jgi:hypothetical protein
MLSESGEPERYTIIRVVALQRSSQTRARTAKDNVFRHRVLNVTPYHAIVGVVEIQILHVGCWMIRGEANNIVKRVPLLLLVVERL